MDSIIDFIMGKIFAPLLVVLVILLILLIAFTPVVVYANNVCLQNGYPDSYIAYPEGIMCGRVVEQTEYVCALNDVLSGTCLPVER